MKRYLKIFGVGLLSFTLLIGCSDKGSKTVASVDGQNIAYSDFLKEMAMYKLQLDSFASSPNFWEQVVPADQSVNGKETTILENFKAQLLENMIEDKIVANEVKNLSLKVDESTIDANVKQYTQTIDAAPAVKKYFIDNKLDENFIKSMVSKDLVKAALEKDFTDKNQVTDAEIDAYYDKNKSEFSNEQVRASHILIKTVNDDLTDLPKDKVEAAKKQIDEIYEKVLAGEDFAELAKQYGQDGTKDKGGDLGYFSKGDMVKEFSDAAFALNVGEISKPIKSQFGYHIIKLTDKKTENTDIAQAKEYIKSLLQKNKFNDYIKELEEKAKITKNEELLKDAEKSIVPLDTKLTEQTKNSNNATQDGASGEKKTESESTSK